MKFILEQETFEDDISYYFPCGKIEPPGSDWLASKEKSVIGAALINSILLGANLPGVGDIESNDIGTQKTNNLMPTIPKGQRSLISHKPLRLSVES